jgi:tellurite resistance protein
MPRPAPGLWRATPPAIFPPILGMFALGLGWRRGAGAFALPEGMAAAAAEALLGGVTLLFAFALVAYGAKVARRPAVVGEDLRVLPGLAGLAAAVLGLYAAAAALAPYAAGAARGLIVMGLALHAALALAFAVRLATGPAEARLVTPVWHLVLVGPIVAALAAAAAGWPGLARAIFWAVLPVAGAIWAASLWQFVRRIPPAPLRPLLAIHIAPASLFAAVAADTGLPFGPTLALAAAALAAVLVAAGRWVTAAGFSALWGAFTFPAGALAGALLAQGWTVAGGLVLIAATLAVPWIAARVMRMWAQGTLAPRTNAAVA